MLRVLASVGHVLSRETEGVSQSLYFSQQIYSALQHVVDSTPLGEVLLRIQFLNPATQSEQVALRDVKCHDFLEQIIQGLVGMCHEHDLLVWEVVEKQIHNLHGGVSLASPRRSHDHGQARVHARPDCLHLHGRKADRVLSRHTLWIRAHVGQGVRRSDHSFLWPLGAQSAGTACAFDCFELQLKRPLQVLRHIDIFSVGKGFQNVVFVQEGVSEVNFTQNGWKLPVLSRSGVSVSEEQIMEPVRYNCVLVVHQAPDRVKDGLEVVLLRLAAQDEVQVAVDLGLPRRHGLQVLMVLRRVQNHACYSSVSDGSLALCRVRIADDIAFVVKQLCDLCSTHAHDTELLRKLRHCEVGNLAIVRLLWCFDPDQEYHIVLSERVPFFSDLRQNSRQRPADFCPDFRWNLLSYFWSFHVHDFQPTQRHHHPSGPGEMRATVMIGGSFHPGNLILKVISYLMRGLQSEQIEVSQQVVVYREELQIELGKCQGVVT
mmetsp:Transcript_72115/g.168979  ORF Transcript_72115/g.168979 Transcript_72115/m.168979 type:complete len:488 (-) Transcript_72115:1383-2846(-)